MNFATLAILSAALLTLLTNSQRVSARTQSREFRVASNDAFLSIGGPPMQTFDMIYNAVGAQYNINPRLLKAVAIVESGEAPQAVNPNDPSYGMMQVLCVPDGQGGCSNRLNVQGWPPESQEQLFDPAYSVSIGAQILDWNIEQYGFPKGVAVYNAWSARHDPQGGPFRNQGYVDKVLGNFDRLGGGEPRDTTPLAE